MGRHVLCALVSLFLAGSGIAQQWTPQSSGTMLPLYGVAFADTNRGWVVGGSNPGTVFHTTDGGGNWEAQSVAAPFSGPAYAVACTDAQNAWLSGGNFVSFAGIQHTSDGGANWIPQTNGVSNTMKALVFVDSLNGWAAGGTTQNAVILHTADGGDTWNTQVAGTVHTLFGLAFANDHSGWAVGRNAGILHTTDAGLTWNTQDAGITTDLYGVAFRDSLNGWAVGPQGSIIHTTDGGGSWSTQLSGTVASLFGVAACRTCGPQAWAVGDSGIILHTDDNGVNWSRQTSGITAGLTAVTFLNSGTGWAVARDGSILRYFADTTHANTPPGPFSRLAPQDSSAFNYGFGGSSVPPMTFRWSASHDPDGDSVTYHVFVFTMENPPLVMDFFTADTTVSDSLLPFANLGRLSLRVWWSVLAADSHGDTTRASNPGGFFDLYFPDEVEQPRSIVSDFILSVYPNPFNPSTTLRFGLPSTSQVTLDIFDVLGRKTENLFSGVLAAGEHEVMWNGSSYPSGIYFARMQAGNQTMQRKMLLIK